MMNVNIDYVRERCYTKNAQGVSIFSFASNDPKNKSIHRSKQYLDIVDNLSTAEQWISDAAVWIINAAGKRHSILTWIHFLNRSLDRSKIGRILIETMINISSVSKSNQLFKEISFNHLGTIDGTLEFVSVNINNRESRNNHNDF